MPISRRGLVQVVGLGAAAAVTRGEVEAPREPVSPDEVELALALVTPLAPGSRFGSWTLERVVLEPSGPSYVLSDGRGVKFQVDVCARDLSLDAPRGPASTEHFDLFVSNEGDGSTDTIEEHGLGAMALAEIIRSNEARVDASACHTLTQRLAANAARRHIG
jgi:hypothetical protein